MTTEGYKDILSITVGANETSKFWLGMRNDVKNRGVEDVLFFCVDGLPGFKEAIQDVYPKLRFSQWKCDKKMDTAISKLESGPKSTNCTV